MKLAVLTGLVSLTLASAAFAVDAPAPTPPAGGPGQHEPRPLRGDANNDGFITKEEWRAQGDVLFKEIDSNGDGKISREEMKAHHEKERNEFKERRAAFGGPEHGGPGQGSPRHDGPEHGGPGGAAPAAAPTPAGK